MKRPIRDCGQLEAVLWLTGAAMFLGGIVTDPDHNGGLTHD